MTELSRERCEACSGDTPPLGVDEVADLRALISHHWGVEEGTRLVRHLEFRTFKAAFNRAGQVAELAEAEGHHPDLRVGWAYLDIELTTHAIGGLSRNDFILAAKIDALASTE